MGLLITAYPTPTPLILTSFQAKTILKERGLYTAALNLVYKPTTAERIRTAWEEGIDWRRDNPMVLAVAQGLQLSPAQVDELFQAGSLIPAGAL